jgi:hypothetical protein
MNEEKFKKVTSMTRNIIWRQQDILEELEFLSRIKSFVQCGGLIRETKEVYQAGEEHFKKYLELIEKRYQNMFQERYNRFQELVSCIQNGEKQQEVSDIYSESPFDRLSIARFDEGDNYVITYIEDDNVYRIICPKESDEESVYEELVVNKPQPVVVVHMKFNGNTPIQHSNYFG